jgi:hypothetical protein
MNLGIQFAFHALRIHGCRAGIRERIRVGVEWSGVASVEGIMLLGRTLLNEAALQARQQLQIRAALSIASVRSLCHRSQRPQDESD